MVPFSAKPLTPSLGRNRTWKGSGGSRVDGLAVRNSLSVMPVSKKVQTPIFYHAHARGHSRPVPLGRLSYISENQHLRWLARNDIETIRNPKGTLQTSIAVVERPSPRFMAWIHHHDVPQMQRSAAANDVWKPCSPMHLMSNNL